MARHRLRHGASHPAGTGRRRVGRSQRDCAFLPRRLLGLTIPLAPPVESLNAAVAAALVLFEIRRRRTEAGERAGSIGSGSAPGPG